MTVKLNSTAFEHAEKLVDEEYFVWDERDAWSEDQLSTQEETSSSNNMDFAKRQWHLGIDEEN